MQIGYDSLFFFARDTNKLMVQLMANENRSFLQVHCRPYFWLPLWAMATVLTKLLDNSITSIILAVIFCKRGPSWATPKLSSRQFLLRLVKYHFEVEKRPCNKAVFISICLCQKVIWKIQLCKLLTPLIGDHRLIRTLPSGGLCISLLL